MANSPKCRERWRIPPGATIHIALHLDECTGGNVLATHSSKKIAFFHLSVDKIGKIQYHQMWLPYAMIGARCHSGFWCLSALTSALLRHFHIQQVHGVRVLGNHNKLNLKAYVGNYDSIVRMYMAKEASGLRPCLLCANILSSRSDVPFHDPHFLTSQSHDTETFQPIVPAELHSSFDELLVACQGSTQTAKQEQERNFWGISCTQSLLNCAVSRELLPLNKIVFDSCHCYYANGACAMEILLFQARTRATA